MVKLLQEGVSVNDGEYQTRTSLSMTRGNLPFIPTTNQTMRTKILLLLLAAIFQLTGHLSAKDKYAIGLFHFNLQYVAGDYKIERRIIRESLYPVLQFFDSHPRYPTDGLEYSPSCGEGGRIVLPAVWKHDPAFALTNGFIYLNNGYSLIKDNTVEHLAATWKVSDRKLVFREELKEGNGSMRMRFYVRKGSAEAGLRFANRLNPFPSYRVDNGRDGFHFFSVVPE